MGFGNLGLDDELVQNAKDQQFYAKLAETEGGITYWDTDMEVSDPGVTYDSWNDYDKGIGSGTDSGSKTTNKQDKTKGVYKPKRHIRKINGGRVLQYPIDIDTNIQDYFEMQVFRYRAAGRLASINTDTEEQLDYDTEMAGYNRRYNRQNLRLEELQSTIQIPIPNSVKDINAVGWGSDNLNPILGTLGGPALERVFGRGSGQGVGADAWGAVTDIGNEVKSLFGNNTGATQFRRRAALGAIAATTAAATGVNIDFNSAITRINGTVINPNMELLFTGPTLREFSFTIRFTPRNPEESEKIRMIIRVLKQHSAVKKNPQVQSGGTDGTGGNFLLGTPDVFKLRYIKAKTQKDIKGLNKFKTCALQSVSVDYTGEAARFAAYNEDSQPVTTLVTLNFTELVPLYDEDYKEFTNDDDVGL